MLAALPVRPGVDTTALNLFLRYRYTPSPLTLYEGIRKLAPGTMVVFENGGMARRALVSFRPQPFSPSKSDAEATEELLDDLQACGEAAADQRRASRSAAQRRGGLRTAARPHEPVRRRTGRPTRSGYGKAAYKDDELGRRGGDGALFSAHATSRSS